jgi:hypothetical protein
MRPSSNFFKKIKFKLLILLIITAEIGGMVAMSQAGSLSNQVPSPFVPTYNGRDPFKALSVFDLSSELTISDLNFNGIIKMGQQTIAMFSLKNDPMVRYLLKGNSLYDGNDQVVQGVAGSIYASTVVLTQGTRKISYPRF